MAATFKFRDNLLELNIAGEIFKIDAASEQTVSALQTLETGSQEYAERAKSIAKSEDTAFISELRDFLADCIKSILGADSIERIFKDRPVSYFDVLDITRFIGQEIPKHITAKTQEINAELTGSREQRRTAKKTAVKSVKNEPADQ
nr:MAG TPA: tail assembly chaperone [Caudoviricetes sp.]